MNSIAGRPIGRPASLCSAAVAGQTWPFFETLGKPAQLSQKKHRICGMSLPYFRLFFIIILSLHKMLRQSVGLPGILIRDRH